MQSIKIILVVCIISLSFTKSYACDSCGGNIGSTFNGLLSLRNSNYITMKWDYTSYISSKSSSHNIQDYFHAIQLSGRYQIKNNWSVQAFVQYLSKSRTEDSNTSIFSGLGDAIASLNYAIPGDVFCSIRKSAEFAAGLKMPTGKYKSSLHDVNLPQNFNLGTGGLGYFVSGNFSLSGARNGMAIYSAYILESKSPDGYKFGNTWSNNLSIFRKQSISPSYTILGSTGLVYEKQDIERFANGNKVVASGSEALLIPISLGITHQKWMVQAKYSMPIYQNFTNHELNMTNRVSVQFSYFLN
ncbi:hypothetical protein [Portibacter lacus]|uniref:Transporter n=1 Tax=Portibacter lacus TaxID=1099794 RepID=A0AA37SRK1_9BACT|nr:hypothetical protein [Portibacter lacus]GLR17556.1 hypothetical protein GCM10007940_21710 [Portibacter lacus]